MTKKTILLADDEEGLRRLVGTTLGEEEFELLEAQDGEEAVSLAREKHPDLVLMDVRMPRLDGFEACRRLKKDPATRGIPVIMLTAAADESSQATGKQVGADGYITKPFSPLALLNRVYQVLGLEQ
jgi:CheY-like chemotaxis protein